LKGPVGYEFVQPSQPPPTKAYWVWMVVVVAAARTAVVHRRRPGAIARAGVIGPEFVQEDA